LLAFFWSGESNDSSLNTGALPAGWSTVATLNTGPRQPAYLVRRTAVASEPTSHAFTSVATGSGRALVGVMLAYRGLDITAPLVASNVTNIVSAMGCIVELSNTRASCPSTRVSAVSFSRTMQVSVAWAGGNKASPPAASMCGNGFYGTHNSHRRVVAVDVTVMQPCP